MINPKFISKETKLSLIVFINNLICYHSHFTFSSEERAVLFAMLLWFICIVLEINLVLKSR